jgi:hypothetical protein
MNGYSELRLQVANDQIRRLHADAASQRLARRTSTDDPDTTATHSIGALFGRSLRILGLAH